MPQANAQPIIPASARALSPKNRKLIEDRIEGLIAVLDAQDAPNEELEDGGDDEPDNEGEGSLGWPEDANQDRAIKACTNDDAGLIWGPDREADNADDEPSLGWTESGERGGWNDMEADYVAFRNGIGQGMTADMEPDIEADHEPRLPPFELNQENGRAL
jgi:hypothetical protein